MANKHHNDEMIVACLKEVLAGKHPADVAKEHGLKAWTVVAWSKKVGIKYQRKSSVYYRDWESIKKAIGL